MDIHINEWYFFIPILAYLLFKTFKDYPDYRGGYISLAGLPNVFWGAITIFFVLIWGGIFWW